MKLIKTFIVSFTLILIVICAVAAEEVGFSYHIDEETGTAVISGIITESAPETVIIPSEIGGKKVTTISNETVVDSYNSVRYDPIDLRGAKHLVISEGIENITSFFVGTENLETVALPKSLKTLTSWAFAYAKKLKSINLEYVEAISSMAFEGCTSLREVSLFSAKKVGINSFAMTENLTIYGKKDSAARKYAEDNNINFVQISEHEMTALKLQELGLMKGIGKSESGRTVFELERTPTRVEAAVMLVRFLGKESEASEMSQTHPFTDIPEWAHGYVSYAYKNGLINGMSNTLFGSDLPATSEMYAAFMLRALGYSDSGENKDFSYEEPWELAKKIGVVVDNVKYEDFRRSDMAAMSYNTLFANIKNTKTTLYEKIVEKK